MAKKIRLDFSKVEERSGWNTRSIPEGIHRMKIEAMQDTEAQDGTDMWVYALVPADPRYKTRRFPFYCKLQQNQLWKVRDLFVAAGIPVPKKAQQLDGTKVVGKFIAAEVTDATGQYEGRSEINGVYGLDVLDEDEDGPGVDDEEEYEDEAEDEVDEDDEVEEEEDEDEEDDLETLTLAELRKLAKSLDIDHAGLKKAELIEAIQEEQEAEEEDDDEDDLDDEDLEDEDLEDEEFEDDEDEEDEPEPAPKRRAAPARKPAAKPAAKAAPKRTVRRR
jgi:hypothetical protein